mmetsp:Transcript_3919/g.11394  ORF Transcript_3919/g.11394 Transcript_3919/m.11394 type:complete len:103 (-) Transcript_3919:158-466(-)
MNIGYRSTFLKLSPHFCCFDAPQSSSDGFELHGSNPPKLVSWPHLVGSSPSEAESSILHDRPDVKVQIVQEGSMVTADYRQDRVRVYVDKERKKVVRAPKVG